MKPEFGKLDKYDSGRRGYAKEIIDYIALLMRNKGGDCTVLDLGCGTGISTRQLHDSGFKVSGVDMDKNMIREALRHNSGIEYKVGSAENLNLYYKGGSFDAVTAFGSFHWFANHTAMKSVRAILRENGLFISVNKDDTGDFRKIFDESVKRVIGHIPKHAKKGYNPVETLRENGFTSIKKVVFDSFELYNLEEVLILAQTLNAWNEVPEELRKKALRELRMRYKDSADEGFYLRKIQSVVVSGINN